MAGGSGSMAGGSGSMAGGGTAGGFVPDSGCVTLTGILAWWDGDAFDGGTATDIVGAQNAIASGGATQIPGRVGDAFSFPISTALLEVPNPSNLTPQTALTFEAWVRPRSTPTGYNRIFSKQLDGSGPDSAYILGIGGMGGIYFSLFKSPTIQTYIDGANPLTVNAWNHIAGTWDGLAMRCYLNGVQQIEALQFTPPYQSSTQPVRIGSGGTSAFRFDGDIDELTIYDRALTATEVAAIFAAGSAGKCKPP